MIMYSQEWWSDDRAKLTYLENRLYQCHSDHNKFHIDWPGIEPGSLFADWQVTNCPSRGTNSDGEAEIWG
jgi:hypothetical protein